MAELLAAQDDRILVEYGVFGLMDLDVEACPRLFPEDVSSRREMVAAFSDNRLDFASATRDHRVAVRLESWSDAPQDPDDGWSGGETVTVRLTSGVVELWSVTMGLSRVGTFDIGGSGRFRVRVWRQGSDAAAELSRSGEWVPPGTERYLVRFGRPDGPPLVRGGTAVTLPCYGRMRT